MEILETSKSPHHFLSQLAGGWTGISKLWLEPDKLAGESPFVGNIQLILDGRFRKKKQKNSNVPFWRNTRTKGIPIIPRRDCGMMV